MIEPFTVCLDRTGRFHHGRDQCTVWLGPDDETTRHLDAIASALFDEFRAECKPHASGFHPHLTLAQTDGRDLADQMCQQLGPGFAAAPIRFKLDAVAIVSRLGKAGRFRTEFLVPLAGAAIQPCHGLLPEPVALPFRKGDPPGALTSLPTWRWDQGQLRWQALEPSRVAADRLPVPLTLVTLNVLCDVFDFLAQFNSAQRFRVLPAALQRLVPTPDIVCLQELSPEPLAALAADPWIRASYYLSDSPAVAATLQASGYGTFVMSRVPFQTLASRVSFTRLVVVARFPADDLVVVPVHLTAGADRRSPAAVAARGVELERILGLLADAPHVILAGDFNAGDAADAVRDPAERALAVPSRLRDVGCDGDATFVPSDNPLAALTSQSGIDARFDRILVSPRVNCVGAAVRVFLDPILDDAKAQLCCLSDHAGLCVQLALPQYQLDDYAEDTTATDELALADLPSHAQVLTRLRLALAPWRVHAVGSAALGLATTVDDLDLVVMAGASRSSMRQRIHCLLIDWQQRGAVSSLRVVDAARVPVFSACIHGVQVDIAWSSSHTDLAGDVDRLSASSVRDVQRIRSALSGAGVSMHRLRALARPVRRWAKARRVYSVSAGYLGGLGWTVQCVRMLQLFAQSGPADDLTHFFLHYSPNDAIPSQWQSPDLTGMEALYVPTLGDHPRNIARSSTASSRARLFRELRRAASVVSLADTASPRLSVDTDVADAEYAGNGGDDHVTQHNDDGDGVGVGVGAGVGGPGVSDSRAAEALDASWLWRGSHALRVAVAAAAADDQGERVAFLSSRAVNAVLAMEHGLGAGAAVACWSGAADTWFFGVTRTLSQDQQHELAIVVQEALRRAWIAAGNPGALPLTLTWCTASEVAALAADGDGDPAVDVAMAAVPACGELQKRYVRNKQLPGGKKQRLRTADEVYNRIRWDASLDASDYTIVYEDRFIGDVEVAVDEFDTETVPWHRVYVFKRAGETVWDRRQRFDAVFTNYQ